MELGLCLGDASKPIKFLQENNTPRSQNFAGIKISSGFINLGKDLCLNQEIYEGNDDNEVDHISEGDPRKTSLQLNLLPFSPVSRKTSSSRIQSLPWSSGSSENDSSKNKGVPATLDVNVPAATDEASTANSDGSMFQVDLSSKREFEATGNNERESSRASDDDDANTRKKLRLSKQQSVFLEQSFKEHTTLNPKQKLALANQLNLRPRQVEVWFQNRRARTKLKQNELDCEYLKRCCETLSEENTRLQKELQDLRALKTPNSNPFYMATTLIMCPSCERRRLASATENSKLTDDDPAPKSIPFPSSISTPRFHPWRN